MVPLGIIENFPLDYSMIMYIVICVNNCCVNISYFLCHNIIGQKGTVG